MADFQTMHGLSMTCRLYVQQALGHTEGKRARANCHRISRTSPVDGRAPEWANSSVTGFSSLAPATQTPLSMVSK